MVILDYNLINLNVMVRNMNQIYTMMQFDQHDHLHLYDITGQACL